MKTNQTSSNFQITHEIKRSAVNGSIFNANLHYQPHLEYPSAVHLYDSQFFVGLAQRFEFVVLMKRPERTSSLKAHVYICKFSILKRRAYDSKSENKTIHRLQSPQTLKYTNLTTSIQ